MEVKASRPIWQAEGEEKRAAVQTMFGEIAPSYDLVNSLMSFRFHHTWRRNAVRVLELKGGQDVLDICCGTGDFLIPLRKAVGSKGRVIGLDFSYPMLVQAKTKTPAELLLGDACQLPFASNSFDAVTVGWGLRNVADLKRALEEIVRVAKPGGRFACLDMCLPAGVLGWFFEKAFWFIVPKIGKVFGKAEAYQYLPESTAKFVQPEVLKGLLEECGIKHVRIRRMYFGNVCLHWGIKE